MKCLFFKTICDKRLTKYAKTKEVCIRQLKLNRKSGETLLIGSIVLWFALRHHFATIHTKIMMIFRSFVTFFALTIFYIMVQTKVFTYRIHFSFEPKCKDLFSDFLARCHSSITNFLNRSSRRKRDMASNPLFIIPEFFLHFPNELC